MKAKLKFIFIFEILPFKSANNNFQKITKFIKKNLLKNKLNN